MQIVLMSLIAVLCFGFALVNGMNDLSGMIATLIVTRAASLRTGRGIAILGVAIGIILGTAAVASTMALGLIDLSHEDLTAVGCLEIWLGATVGAVSWVLLARHLGIPSSATHAFVGAICGAGLAGTVHSNSIHWGFQELVHRHQVTGVMKVFAGLILSPLLGGALGFGIYRLMALTLRRASFTVSEWLRRLECLAVLGQAINYGLNDAHSVMGVLVGAMISGGFVGPVPAHAILLPRWIELAMATAIGLGTLLGSSAIMRTVGTGLFHVRPAEALAGQVAAALSVFGASTTGAPVSSSQVISSALVGVGTSWRPRQVRWFKVGEILMTWVITFPLSLLFGWAITCALRWSLPAG